MAAMLAVITNLFPALMLMIPVCLGLVAISAILPLFRHPVARRLMAAAIVVSTVVFAHLLLQWGLHMGYMEPTTTNMTNLTVDSVVS